MHFILKELFASLNGSFAEFFHVFHNSEGSLASASAGSFVTLLNLSVSILYEYVDFSFDLFN